MRLHFSNLPLIETAVRFSLEPPLPITVATATQVYQHVAEQYPALEDASNFEAPPGVEPSVFAQDLTSFLGFRTTNVQSGLALTFQRRLLSSRWSDNLLNPSYAGFESLIEGLERGIAGLGRAEIPPPRPIVANMLYINFISGDSASIDRFLRLGPPVEVFRTALMKQRLVVSWQEDGGIDLTIDLQAATKSRGEDVRSGYQITTIAGTRHLNPENPIETLWQLHDRLQVVFFDLMTDDAKAEWGLTVEN